jgi:phosphoglycerate dehydrogenase-like enzyme
LLALVRGLPEHAAKISEGKWERKSQMSFRLNGKTFGILGWGRIGQATARRAAAFGMDIVYFDPFIKEDKPVDGVRAKRAGSLGELARVSDVISVHTPLTAQTKGMLNANFFKKVKRNVILLNSARGPVIDLNALYEAMKNDMVLGAGIDALPTEFEQNSIQLIKDYEQGACWLRGRFIITPHTAYYSHEAIIELRSKAALEAKRVLDGQEPLNCVNKN